VPGDRAGCPCLPARGPTLAHHVGQQENEPDPNLEELALPIRSEREAGPDVPRMQGFPAALARLDCDDALVVHLRPSGYHFAFFLPFSRHNSRQLAATSGASRQVRKSLTLME
jgi:hypothetical protein